MGYYCQPGSISTYSSHRWQQMAFPSMCCEARNESLSQLRCGLDAWIHWLPNGIFLQLPPDLSLSTDLGGLCHPPMLTSPEGLSGNQRCQVWMEGTWIWGKKYNRREALNTLNRKVGPTGQEPRDSFGSLGGFLTSAFHVIPANANK